MKTTATKHWKNCEINELEAGDILMFRPNMKVLMSQVGIMIYQSLFNRKGGHFDTVHVGICSGRNTADEPTLAHMAILPNVPNDYYHEPIKDMLMREGGDRAFIVYRPKDINFAATISQIATTEKRNLNWSVPSALTSALPASLYANDAPKTVATNTFCSRFAIQVMKLAAKKTGGAVINVCSRSTPKTLESFLENSATFEKFCYLGQNPFQRLDEAVIEQLIRLGRQKHAAAQEKFTHTYAAYQKANNYIALHNINNETDKIQVLLQTVLPEFAKHTNWNVTPTSYKKLTGLARSMGIFKKNIDVANTVEVVDQTTVAYRVA